MILQARDKACGGEKQGRAGPGTGSMGGKCSVCGDRATKVWPTVNCGQLLPTIANYTLQFRYSLYSTTSCFSCRAFFRRSLVGGKFETFSCRSLGEARQCQVTAANRKKCQACR